MLRTANDDSKGGTPTALVDLLYAQMQDLGAVEHIDAVVRTPFEVRSLLAALDGRGAREGCGGTHAG